MPHHNEPLGSKRTPLGRMRVKGYITMVTRTVKPILRDLSIERPPSIGRPPFLDTALFNLI